MRSLCFPVTLLAAACMLAACGNNDRTTSVPRGADAAAATVGEPAGPSAAPAPAERGPVAANANTMAPGTDASLSLANPRNPTESTAPANDPRLAERAQEAAARAPDTASADAAKREVLEGSATHSDAAPADRAQEGADRKETLTKSEEKNAMPKPGQANDHSTTAGDAVGNK